MEKDLIFPMFVKQKGQIKVQGIEVLYPISVIKYLVKRFKYKGTRVVREGEYALYEILQRTKAGESIAKIQTT